MTRACIVAVQPPAVAVQPVSGPQYRSSIRNALRTGQQRDLLGYCIPGADWTVEAWTGRCGSPHAVEVLGSGSTGENSVSRGQLELTCRLLVRGLTGMSDPTAAGGLAVQVHVDDSTNTVVSGRTGPCRLLCQVRCRGHRLPKARRQPLGAGVAADPVALNG